MIVIGVLLFPQVEELDFIGPWEVLSYLNKIRPYSLEIMTVASSTTPLTAFNGLTVTPQVTIEECPQLDILVIPGGKGRLTAMRNETLLSFIRRQAAGARWIVSVCTGAFLLAQAGLLVDKQATTHHNAFEELAAYGVKVVTDRKVVRDGSVITAGGVSSGLELGFYLIQELFGADIARKTAAGIEYRVDWESLQTPPERTVQ